MLLGNFLQFVEMPPFTIILSIFLLTFIQNIDANDLIPDAVVSIWRLDDVGELAETFICIGPLIKPNWILIINDFLVKLEPFNTLGFFTQRSLDMSHKIENSAIVERIYIPEQRQYSILVIKPGISLPTPYIMNTKTLCGAGEEIGFLVGWNNARGAVIKSVTFSHVNGIFRVEGQARLNTDNFPIGSFLLKEKGVLAICHSISESGLYELKLIRGKLQVLRNLFYRYADQDTSIGGPFPEAVASFWRLDREGKPIALLYVGALITSNWILVPYDSLSTLYPFVGIGLQIGQHDRTRNLILHDNIGMKRIPETDRFIIIIIIPGIRAPTPYIATNPSTCFGGRYDVNLIGWHEQVKDGPMSKPVTIIDFMGIHLETEDESTSSNNFCPGSFIVRGKDIIAVAHNMTNEGILVFLKISPEDSQAIRQLLMNENRL